MSTTYNHISMKRGLNWNLNVYKEMHFFLENFFLAKLRNLVTTTKNYINLLKHE